MHTLTFCHLEKEEGLFTEDQNADQCKNAMREVMVRQQLVCDFHVAVER